MAVNSALVLNFLTQVTHSYALLVHFNLGVHLLYVCALSSSSVASTHGAKKEDRDSVIQLLEAEVPRLHAVVL